MNTATYLIAIGSNVRTRWGTPQALIEFMIRHIVPKRRHAELVSASILKRATPPHVEKWTLKQFQGDGDVIWSSSTYVSAPIGPGKRSYANAVALIQSALAPPDLLSELKQMERAAGRRRGQRWGDRPLDLDIIAWSDGIWSSPSLTIPHPAFRTRRFVLAPLCEIAPGWRDPVTHLTGRQLLARLDQKRRRA